MPQGFNPYHKWFGIPPEEQPPNHYRLLGIPLFESDPEVIANAADQRMAHVKSFQTGGRAALSQTLLNELAVARVCLLDPRKKTAYDAELRGAATPQPAPLVWLEPGDQPPRVPHAGLDVVMSGARSPGGRPPRPLRAKRKTPWVAVLGVLAGLATVVLIAVLTRPKKDGGGDAPAQTHELPAQAMPEGKGIIEQPIARRPSLAAIADQSVDQGTQLRFRVDADQGSPARRVKFVLGTGAPPGARIDAKSGVFTWTPEKTGPYSLVVRALDPESDELFDQKEFRAEVKEVNAPPAIATISPKEVRPNKTVSFEVPVLGADVSRRHLTFELRGDTHGAKVSGRGVFAWTPTVEQAGKTYQFTVRVADESFAPQFDERTFDVAVLAVEPPAPEIGVTATSGKIPQTIALDLRGVAAAVAPALTEAMQHWQAARDPTIAKDVIRKAAELTAARKMLEEARGRLIQAAGEFHEQLEAVQGNRPEDKKLRAKLSVQCEGAAFQASLCDYYLGQTYENRKDRKRREMLERASKEFDDIFQRKRGESDISVYTHMWQGKAVMELGDDPDLAKDIFEEVLANFETGEGVVFTRETGALYAEVKQFYLGLLAQDPEKDPREAEKDFVSEARRFCEVCHRKDVQTDWEFVRTSEGYQGISVALAKALLAEAEKATGPEKSKLNTEAAEILDDMVEVSSSYQKEAIELRRGFRGPSSQQSEGHFEAVEREASSANAYVEPALDGFNVMAWDQGAKVVGKGGGSGFGGSGFGGRGSGHRAAMLSRYGGTKQSERAVAGALHWLMRHQMYDGSWSFDKYKARCKDASCTGRGSAHADAGATGMALLCYLGAGQTHKTKGPYRKNIERALLWLVRHQDRNGNLARDCISPMYSHGIATIALCEAFGLSGDRNVGQAAQGAINYIIAAQNPNDDGWRYNPGDPGDTSVVGWQIMALKSAQMAGLNVGGSGAGSVFDRAGRWLDRVKTGPNGSQFQYQPGTGPTPTMSAAGLLCRQYLHAKRTDPMMVDGVKYLMQNLPDLTVHNVYYWYYATQVLHNYTGYEWDTWNRAMRKLLITTQTKSSNCANGSWDPDNPSKDQWSPQGGRHMITALSCVTLEIYYRYLPLYKVDAEDIGVAGFAKPAATGNPRD